MAWGYVAHLIRLVLWRGTAGEELAYKGALSSDRPLHRATASAIGSLQVNHKASHAWGLTQGLSGYPIGMSLRVPLQVSLTHGTSVV